MPMRQHIAKARNASPFDLGKLLGTIKDPEPLKQKMSEKATTSAELLVALEALDQAAGFLERPRARLSGDLS